MDTTRRWGHCWFTYSAQKTPPIILPGKNKKMNSFCILFKKLTGLEISIEAKEENYKELRKQEGNRRVWPFLLFMTLVFFVREPFSIISNGVN